MQFRLKPHRQLLPTLKQRYPGRACQLFLSPPTKPLYGQDLGLDVIFGGKHMAKVERVTMHPLDEPPARIYWHEITVVIGYAWLC